MSHILTPIGLSPTRTEKFDPAKDYTGQAIWTSTRWMYGACGPKKSLQAVVQQTYVKKLNKYVLTFASGYSWMFCPCQGPSWFMAFSNSFRFGEWLFFTYQEKSYQSRPLM